MCVYITATSRNAAWRDASIDRAEFIGCRVTGLDLAEMTGTGLVFRECSGPLASLRFAAVKRTKFENCDISEIDFQNATLVATVFRGCNLRAAVFFGAKVGGTDTRLPPRFAVRHHRSQS